MKKRIAVAALALVALAALARTSLPAQPPWYAVKDTGQDKLRNIDGQYTVFVNRVATNKSEADLIRKAEFVYPQRAAAMAAAPRRSPDEERPFDTQETVWWCDKFDGVRIPYAVTAGTIAYYQSMLGDFIRGDFRRSHGIPMTRASLIYEARIHAYDKWEHGGHAYANVRIVFLKLRWSQWCGSLCAMGFNQSRYVAFDSAGRVLAVLGDSRPSVVVS